MPESIEHRILKEIMKVQLQEWLEGLTLKEFPVSGYEADVYGISKDKVIIHAEVIWSLNEYGKNIISLLISDADLKIAVFSPKALKRFGRDYNKVRLEQLKKGYSFSEPVEGERLLEKDSDYIAGLREETLQTIERIPREIPAPFPRSYWYINDELIKEVTDSLKETKWTNFPTISQISLLERKYLVCPKKVEDNDLGLVDEDFNITLLKDLNWSKSKKLVKFFGRFYTPFGVDKENIIRFIPDPCYFRHSEVYSQDVHIQPKYIRGSVESASSLGLERWQTPSVFIIGLLKQFQIWQPFVIEPLCIYTSAEEKEEFHGELINKAILPLRDADEFGFEDLSEKYGLEKAQEFEESFEKEMRKVLSKNCWDKPSEISELAELFSITIDLMREKDESDAVVKIIGYAEMSSLELAHQMFKKSKSSLMEFDQKYRSFLSQVLSNLGSKLQLGELISKELAFYDLIIDILEKGKLEIIVEKKNRWLSDL